MRPIIALACITACNGPTKSAAPDSGTSTPDANVVDASGSDAGSGATSPALVIAFEAPSPADTTHFDNFLSDVLPNVSGIGAIVRWSAIDACGAAPCATEPDFHWAALDSLLMKYATNATTPFGSGCAGGRACKIVLIVSPTGDSGDDNTYTPSYVYSQSYATSLGAPPQDVAVCKNMQGGSEGWAVGSPITGTFGGADFATWNVAGGQIVAGSGLALTGPFPTTNFSGFPVEYEVPFTTAYEHFLAALLVHYSAAGSGDGPTLAPYFAYIRVGFHGGEDDPACASTGFVPSTDWTASAAVRAGDLIQPTSGNAGDYYFVANSDGASAATAPTWCQTAGCNTAADGSVASWRNTGLANSDSGAVKYAMWPGPNGAAKGFTDAAYLGFVHSVYAFIAAQHSAIPLDISSHDGPPFNANWAYADASAVSAVANGLGFGNESVSLSDIALYNAGKVTRHDWVENFDVFRTAPVIRHLQTYWPGGGGVQAETFAIDSITVSAGVATATCGAGCSLYCTGTTTVQVTGNANDALNGSWFVAAASCTPNTMVQFAATGVADGTYAGGQIWAADYLPAVLPFAFAHAATTIELHECTLDYAYGAQTVGTAAHACAGLPGPDATYKALIAGAQQ